MVSRGCTSLYRKTYQDTGPEIIPLGLLNLELLLKGGLLIELPLVASILLSHRRAVAILRRVRLLGRWWLLILILLLVLRRLLTVLLGRGTLVGIVVAVRFTGHLDDDALKVPWILRVLRQALVQFSESINC